MHSAPTEEDTITPDIEALDDDALAAQAGQNPEAFTVLYTRHLDDIYRYILSHVRLVADAQDITTQTFMGALKGIAHYEGRGAFKAWLVGIAKRKLIDHYRREKLTFPLDELEIIANNSPPIEELVEHKLRLETVIENLRLLNEDRAEAIRLRIFSGLSSAEAGEIMGKSADAINMLVYRGLNDLRKQFNPTGKEMQS